MQLKKVLVIGNGGREHALIWKIKQSPLLSKIYTTNKHFKDFAEYVDVKLDNFLTISYVCKTQNIDLVVVGQEEYLAKGLADILAAEGIAVFGPSQNATKLESSKFFTKELCSMHDIPTANFGYFTSPNPAKEYVKKIGVPLVVKANGLACGKGVIICTTNEEANTAIDDILCEKKFGEAGNSIIIEEFLHGEEISYFSLVDGQTVLPIGCARDYKQVTLNGKTYNTGGMGAFSPIVLDNANEQNIMRQIIYPTVNGLSALGITYKGVLFAGIMLTSRGPKLLEYNVRFGDPETQVIIPRLKSDLLDLMIKTTQSELNKTKIEFYNTASLCLVLASNGYPLGYDVGFALKNINEALSSVKDLRVFNAGVAIDDNGNMFSNGGRVLNLVVTGQTLLECREKAYQAARIINWKEGFYIDNVGINTMKQKL